MAVCEHHAEFAAELHQIHRKVDQIDGFLRGSPDGDTAQPGLQAKLISHEVRLHTLESEAVPWRKIALTLILSSLLLGTAAGAAYRLTQTAVSESTTEQIGGD